MKPDVIVSWPNNCDYPLWRQFIRDNRYRFSDIIIVFTETHQEPSYKTFVKEAMKDDYVVFIDAPFPQHADEDWRNLAVNKALEISRSSWVWFTEQDFYPKNYFWDQIEADMMCDIFDVIATYDERRMHPCNIFAKRETIDKTRKNFGIIRDVSDHFSIFQDDLESGNAKISRVHPSYYFHYNGLSSNFTLLTNGQEPNWRPDEFKEYLRKCLEVTVPIDPGFKNLLLEKLR